MAARDLFDDELPERALARLGSTRLMHPYDVRGLAFSADGRFVGSCAEELLVSLTETGETVFRLKGHRGRIDGLAFSPDGSRLASVAQDGTLRLWCLRTGACLAKLGLDREEGRAVAFAGDALIVVGSYTHVRVFTTKGKLLTKLEQGEGWVCGLVCDAARVRAYVATERGLWRFALPEPGLFSTKQPPSSAHRLLDEQSTSAVALTPDGGLLAAAGVDGVALWEVEAARPLRTLGGGAGIHALAFSPDGTSLVGAGRDGALLWNLEKDDVHRFAPNSYGVAACAFSPNGTVIATGGHGGDVRLWDTRGETEVLSWPRHADRIGSISFSGDGRYLVSATSRESLRLWDCDSGRLLHQLAADKDGGHLVAYSPREPLFAHAGGRGSIALYDATTAEPKAELTNKDRSGWFRSLAFSPDGQWLAACEGDTTLHLWSPAHPLPRWSKKVALGSHVAGLRFSPDGTILALCGSGPVGLWRVADGKALGKLGENVCAIGFLAQGTLVGVCTDEFVRWWDIATGEQQGETWYSGGWPMINAQGNLIAFADDSEVRFRALPGLELLGAVARAGNWLCMTFSPDGRRFACAERARNLLTWEVGHLPDAPRGAAPVYDGAAALADYRLVLATLPAARFAEVRVGDRCSHDCSPTSDAFDFLGIIIHVTDEGRVLAEDDDLRARYLDPPASPLIPMAGYFSRGPGADIDKIYVVAVDTTSGARFRGQLIMDRPSSGHAIPPPISDDDELEEDSASRSGSWFTINLSEQIPLPDKPAVYRVYLEHAIVRELRSTEVVVRVTVG